MFAESVFFREKQGFSTEYTENGKNSGAAGIPAAPFMVSFFDLYVLLAVLTAPVATAGTVSRAVTAYQRNDRSPDGGDDDYEYYRTPDAHWATASVRAAFALVMNGSLETSRYTSATTEITAITIPDISGEVPSMKLPMTYTMDAMA